MNLFSNIRFWVLLFSFCLALGINLFVSTNYPEYIQPRRLTQFFALASVAYLYLAILTSPLTRAFSGFPYRAQYTKARRAIGVSAFFFAAFHARNSFFNLLGGFEGFFALSGLALIAIIAALFALIILSIMAATSFDYMVDKLTFSRWKALHRFVYLASVLIIFHAVIMGEHFRDLSSAIPIVFIVLIVFLLLLEAKRIFTSFSSK